MLNQDLKPFLAVWDEKWSRVPLKASPKERREAFEGIAHEMRLASPPDVDPSTEHWIESEAGNVRVRIFRHRSDGTQPALIYMHGGGWMQGSPETHWDITSRIASWARMTVISVDYALAPEHPYPAAFLQCADVVRWTARNAVALRIDETRIAIGGDSAGANLAAAVSLRLRDKGPALAAQLLIYGAFDFDLTWPSCKENPDGPIIKVAGMGQTRAMYCPNEATAASDPYAAPLAAASHAGLPPAFVAVAEHDPLRDSGKAYAGKLRTAGTPVAHDPGIGLIHGYLRAMEYCSASVEKLKIMSDWLAGTLRTK